MQLPGPRKYVKSYPFELFVDVNFELLFCIPYQISCLGVVAYCFSFARCCSVCVLEVSAPQAYNDPLR